GSLHAEASAPDPAPMLPQSHSDGLDLFPNTSGKWFQDPGQYVDGLRWDALAPALSVFELSPGASRLETAVCPSATGRRSRRGCKHLPPWSTPSSCPRPVPEPCSWEFQLL